MGDHGSIGHDRSHRLIGTLLAVVALMGCSSEKDSEGQRMTTRVAYGDAPQQFGDLYLAAGDEPAPVVVLIHGGFWREQYGLDLMVPLRRGSAGTRIRRLEHRVPPGGPAGRGLPRHARRRRRRRRPPP